MKKRKSINHWRNNRTRWFHLAEFLLEKGYRGHMVLRDRASSFNAQRIDHIF